LVAQKTFEIDSEPVDVSQLVRLELEQNVVFAHRIIESAVQRSLDDVSLMEAISAWHGDIQARGLDWPRYPEGRSSRMPTATSGRVVQELLAKPCHQTSGLRL